MPLKIAEHLRFGIDEGTEPLGDEAKYSFVILLRKVQGAGSRKATLEVFKRHFARARGSTCSPSSDVGLAEYDRDKYVDSAAEDAPTFIAAFYDACEELAGSPNSEVPTDSVINSILSRHGLPYQVEQGLLVCGEKVGVPRPTPGVAPDEAVARALKDASALIESTGASSGLDRVHTALHGYLRSLCAAQSLSCPQKATLATLFKTLRTRTRP